MSTLSFAEDFSRLIVRYTKTTSINDGQSKDAPNPLTHEEITSIIITVLSALGIKSRPLTNITSVLENSSADSSVNTTVTTLASSLTLTRSKQDDETRRLSINDESAFNLSTSCLSPGVDETETKTPLTSLRNQDKSISHSNPVIRVNDLGRSGTFVREIDQKGTADDEVFEAVSNVDSLNDSFLELFNNLSKIQSSVNSFMSQLDKVKKQVYNNLQSDKLHKNHGSSTVNQKSTSTKTNLPVAMRRSSSAYSGTPTTSKLRSVGKENISDRRKSVSSASAEKIETKNTEKLNKPAKPTGRSLSNLNLSMCDNVSLTLTTKFVKNPKYAHVQSTIPKPIRMNNKKT